MPLAREQREKCDEFCSGHTKFELFVAYAGGGVLQGTVPCLPRPPCMVHSSLVLLLFPFSSLLPLVFLLCTPRPLPRCAFVIVFASIWLVLP